VDSKSVKIHRETEKERENEKENTMNERNNKNHERKDRTRWNTSIEKNERSQR